VLQGSSGDQVSFNTTVGVRGWVLNGPQDVRLQKGEEIGPFILSSNVVMLFPENSIQLPADWASTRPLKIGEAMSRN